ncbi:hypothetical protein HYDPIDRAFT_26793 [Hydnomerulius pinastri MD-312]|nr:hypothetical protein HYDPIDRAFT_26793 [Hydnomerulius pinastri MD-312]
MASDLQTSLWALRFGDCFSLVMATAVVYDYTLTFAQEVEYVWKRPWTSLSTLFVVLRYFGLPLAMVYALCEYESGF